MFQTLAAFGHFATLDFSGLARITSLLVLPFAHEDLAIVFGGYFIVNNLMPVGLVALSIYGGMVASDFALYGIGAAARHLPWLRRFAVDDRVRRFGETLKRNVFGLVALCRVVPGVVFVAFVACGWTRVSLARFTAASLIISALYLPLMLYLVIVFGDALDDRLGLVGLADAARRHHAPPTSCASACSPSARRAKPDAAGEAVLPADLLRHAAAGARRPQGRQGRAHSAAAVLCAVGDELDPARAALSVR